MSEQLIKDAWHLWMMQLKISKVWYEKKVSKFWWKFYLTKSCSILFKFWIFLDKVSGKKYVKVSTKSDNFSLNKILLGKWLLKIMINFLPHIFKKSIRIVSRVIFRAKFLFNKNLSDLIETFTYFCQTPYSKNVEVWTKLDSFLLNKIFIRVFDTFISYHTLDYMQGRGTMSDKVILFVDVP